MKKHWTILLVAAMPLAASAQDHAAHAHGGHDDHAAHAAAAGATRQLPEVVVHKDPNCGCCNGWIRHLQQAGFKVTARDESDMTAVKQRLGIPAAKHSCHTAEIGGYVVEGHVPAAHIKHLLAAKPRARGLVLPGMPIGSPGMEAPDGRVDAYTVELLEQDGGTKPFVH
jgi:hypothetical protein